MKNKNTLVGIFVVAGLLLFSTGLFLIGDRHQAFARHSEYYAEFRNLAGVSTGSKIRVAGVDAGQVISVAVPPSPSAKFRVLLKIDNRLSGLVRTDSVVSIGTQGVVGDVYLSVRPGSPRAPAAKALSTLPSKEPLDMSEVLEKGSALLSDADGAINQVSDRLDGTLDELRTTLSNADDVVVGLKRGHGTAGMLLRDQALAQNLRDTLNTTASNVREVVADLRNGRGAAGLLLRDKSFATRIQDAVASADHASGQADAILSNLESRQFSEKLDQVITSAKSTAANADHISQQLEQIMSEIALPDNRGTSAGANIRESLANVSISTGNIADDTEALKHNFLLRGFFRQRGYYNVSHLSTDKYRQDSFFTSPKNRRMWFSGSELFYTSSTGLEDISDRGKALLDAAMVQYHDSSNLGPVVVEGYWGGNDPMDQLAFSRSRAILVTRYLENRFHIDSESIGSVSMNNVPPVGLGHSTWDGICIVIPHKATHSHS